MLGFWLSAAVLLAAVVYGLLRPLLRAAEPPDERKALNLRVFRERLAELEAERDDGRLAEADFAALRKELELTLLSDVPAGGPALGLGLSVKPVLFAVFLLVPLLSLGLYAHLGAVGEAERWQAARMAPGRLDAIVAAIDQAGAQEDIVAMQDALLRLRALLVEQPDNTDAWYALGRAYVGMNQAEAGVAALEQGYRRAPEDVAMMVGYAQGLILANQGQATAQTDALLREALQRNPRHEGALMLQGFSLFGAGRYAEAIAAWESLKALRPEGSEGRQLLEQSIAEAKRRMGEGTDGVELEITLAEALKARLGAGDRLFVYARAAEGPAMPVAATVIEQPVWPVKLRLSDAQAMTAERKLSQFPRIVVGARISKSGQALPQAGDLEGLSGVLVQSELRGPLRITIDTVRR